MYMFRYTIYLKLDCYNYFIQIQILLVCRAISSHLQQGTW